MLLPSGRQISLCSLFQLASWPNKNCGRARTTDQSTSFNLQGYSVYEVPGLLWVPCQRQWGIIKSGIINFHTTFGLRFEFIGRTAAKKKKNKKIKRKCSPRTAMKTSKRGHHSIWFSYVRHDYISVRNFIAFLGCIQ